MKSFITVKVRVAEKQPIYGSSRLGMRLGNGLEVKRINFPLQGDPAVVSDGSYTTLGQLMSASISSTGAFITGAKAMPGISASLKALTADSYSISLFTNNANTYGDLEFNLLQNNAQSIWSGEAASTGTWSHTIMADEETSNYQLSVRQKNARFDQPIARHIHGKQYEITDHLGNVRAVVGSGVNYNSVGKTIIPRIIATNTYYPFGMLIESLSTNSEGYRYGFNGKEKDDKGEWGMTHYDYGFRIYNPATARFLSVDPLSRNFPWNSSYAYAENDVVRSIDLDGLEKVAVIYSPFNSARIKNFMQKQNYRKVMDIIEYSATHGWVDENGKPSDWIMRKYKETHGNGRKIQLADNASTSIFDNWEKPDLVNMYGNINDHGGYMELSFFNWETQEYEDLGVLPLSKSREHQRLITYQNTDEFWNTEPTYSSRDLWKELGRRIIPLGVEELLKKGKGPFFINVPDLLNMKFQFAVRGRLRQLGANSAFETDVFYEGECKGTWRLEYQIDNKGKETWTESFNENKGGIL